jgi:predicted ribosome quality control (RQC) complex YloA/Tae2 family protein
MRKSFLLLAAVVLVCSPRLMAQEDNLTAESVTAQLDRYEATLQPLDSLLDDLESENLQMNNDSGAPQEHRPIQNRRQALQELRQTIQTLRAQPEDLKGVVTLLVQSEALSDELFDLVQVAYDNDREELGRRISEVVTAIDAQQESVQALTMALADQKEARIKKLEEENETLRKQLKQAREKH